MNGQFYGEGLMNLFSLIYIILFLCLLGVFAYAYLNEKGLLK